jgi:hypothetical protein
MICLGNLSSQTSNKKIEIKEGKAVITETKEIDLGNTKDIELLKRNLKARLAIIIQEVKSLKFKAEEIKEMLNTLDAREPSMPQK